MISVLRKYDYAWNKREKGGHDGLRPDVLPRDPEDSEDDDDDDVEET